MKASDIPDVVALQACSDAHAALIGSRSIDLIIQRTGAPSKVAYAKLDKLDRRGLIEYGVSLGTAWPTDKGRALLVKGGTP